SLPQLPAFVKPFFHFPQNFFQSFDSRVPCGDSSLTLPDFPRFVNTLFEVFSVFFRISLSTALFALFFA
ncbi:MAG: hypothetical protein K2P10_10405, partial [Oscillospiraceae bacterium]|nr:hypothetical protein [Oscillospiraceae bacterium]